jgi:transposase
MTIIIERNGEQLTLRKLAKREDLSYEMLRKRYEKGERGERLVRKPDRRQRPSGFKAEQQAAAADREQRRQLAAANASKQRAQRAALATALAEHAAAFSRPLIDAALLTSAEQNEVRKRIGRGLRWDGVESA